MITYNCNRTTSNQKLLITDVAKHSGNLASKTLLINSPSTFELSPTYRTAEPPSAKEAPLNNHQLVVQRTANRGWRHLATRFPVAVRRGGPELSKFYKTLRVDRPQHQNRVILPGGPARARTCWILSLAVGPQMRSMGLSVNHWGIDVVIFVFYALLRIMAV